MVKTKCKPNRGTYNGRNDETTLLEVKAPECDCLLGGQARKTREIGLNSLLRLYHAVEFGVLKTAAVHCLDLEHAQAAIEMSRGTSLLADRSFAEAR